MSRTDLLGVANNVVHRAQRQGFVIAREIREAVSQAGAPDKEWKEVVSLAGPALNYRRGRYYYAPCVSERVRQEQEHQRSVQQAVRQLIQQYKEGARPVERRENDRIDFIQPVKVITHDQREFTVLSRDISTTGIRLIGPRSLLGQKVQILVPRPDNTEPWCFLTRILWTCAVSDELFENGGAFLEVNGSQIQKDEG